MYRLSASFILKVPPDAADVTVVVLTTASFPTLLQQRPRSIRADPPPVCREGVLYLSHTLWTLLCFIFCLSAPSRIKSSPAAAQHGLERQRPMDYPLCALRRGWWGEKRTCFRKDILTKTGTEREPRPGIRCFSLPRFASFIFLLFFLFLFSCYFLCGTEKCLQNCCAAPWLWSCMSTLWAPISATMTGTTGWMNDIQPHVITSLHVLTCTWSVLDSSRAVMMGFIHHCISNTNSWELFH